MKLYLDPLPKLSIHSMPQSEIHYIYVPETNDRPEKRFLLNETAFEIIKLYNGLNTYNEIIMNLSERYKDSPGSIEVKINSFISMLKQYGYSIKEQAIPVHHNCIINVFNNLYPTVVNLEITEKCNLMCKHCYGEYGSIKQKNMKLKDVEFILKSLKDIGIHTIEITGGEPSIHPDVSHILSKVDEIGIPTVMFLTNGLYLSDELLESMIAIKNKLFVQVSLHTLNSEYFDWFTGSKNKLSIVKENIKRLVKNDIKVRVTATITPKNIDEIVEVADWAFDNGAKLYAPSTVISLGRATDTNESTNLHFTNEMQYHKLQNSISRIHEKYPVFILEREEAKTNCGALTTQCSITVNGDLKLCNMDSGEYFNLMLGNSIQEPIKMLYDKHTDFFEALRIMEAPNYDSEGCRNCEERVFCSHCILRGLIGAKRIEKECHWYENINPILKEHFA